MAGPRKKCSVLMPLSDTLRRIYTEVYQPVCAANGLRSSRIDESARPGFITKHMIKGILAADIVIADLTTKNPNVFYELGVAHSTINKTIMTAQASVDVPFAIAGNRLVFYEPTRAGCKKFAVKLDREIKELLALLDQANHLPQDVLVNDETANEKGRIPLSTAVDFEALGKPVRDFISENNLLYLEDLKGIDIVALSRKPGFGAKSMGQLCSILIKYDLYGDVEAFHRFIVDEGIDTENNRVARNLGFGSGLSAILD